MITNEIPKRKARTLKNHKRYKIGYCSNTTWEDLMFTFGSSVAFDFGSSILRINKDLLVSLNIRLIDYFGIDSNFVRMGSTRLHVCLQV